MRFEIQPIGNWTDATTDDRRRSQFRAAWSDTLELLRTEVYYLGAELVVLQIDVTAGDLRRDGMLRANARVGFPGVRVSFNSVYGPLTYSTDRFDDWQDNIRAIALALKALRAVDRYGVNKRGEQYTGWLAIEAGPNMDVTAAEALIRKHGGDGGIPAALKATHPDLGGNRDDFDAVQIARAVLAGAH